MKIVFFGSGKFAVNILEAIHKEGHEVVLVITQPDRKKGRHLHLAETPVKTYAITHTLAIFQPENINQSESMDMLKKAGADIFLVVSYGRILSSEVLKVASKMCINIHASLLPEYRGAAPIQWALINNEKKTGVTFIKMNEKMDRGEIIFKKSVAIKPHDNFPSLEKKLSDCASASVNLVLRSVFKKPLRLTKQNERDVTYAPMLKKHDGLINWSLEANKIYDRFRGCFGWPGSFTYYKGKLLKICAIRTKSNKMLGIPGEIITASHDILQVACSKGTLLINEVLPESHRKMSTKDFLAGHHVKVGEILGGGPV
jgi:methionyl-tRNA formyltransferase